MEKLYYAAGGWMAFNIILVIALLNRRHAPHLRHRFARWVLSTPRAARSDTPLIRSSPPPIAGIETPRHREPVFSGMSRLVTISTRSCS